MAHRKEAIMYYVITQNTQGEKPYGFYKFSSLKQAKGSNVVDEHAMVFSTPEQLAENFSVEEINGVISVVSKKQISVGKNIKLSAKQLFDITTEKAVTVKHVEPTVQEDTVKEEVVQPVEKVVEKTAKKKSKVKASAKQKQTLKGEIKVLKPFTGNPNSIRGKNMAIILNSTTTDVAILEMTIIGVEFTVARSFIRWAVAEGYIEVIGE